MKTILKIAWRNIWRNPLRSIIVISSILLGIWAGVFVVGFSYGLNKQRTFSTIANSVSHIQIHHPEFEKDEDVRYQIDNLDLVLNYLDADTNIVAYSYRSTINGMVGSAVKNKSVRINGIDQYREKEVTQIHQKLSQGNYFEKKGRNPVVIGEALAKKLNVRLKSKIILTFQDAEHSIISGAFRICGIYKTQSSKYDELNVFILNKDLQRLLGTSMYHEIAILCNSMESVDSTQQYLASSLENLRVEDWKDLAPELAYADEVMETWLLLIIAIIMLALIFGIINTMLMAVLERKRELGMLMAIGMNKSKVFAMILFETFFLSLIGGPAGILFGYITIQSTSVSGINLSFWGAGLESVGLSSMVYPDINPKFYIYISAMVIITTLIASIYPARKALKLNPTEAIRTI